jgi:membrane fusion protein, heavy metal efflux system
LLACCLATVGCNGRQGASDSKQSAQSPNGKEDASNASVPADAVHIEQQNQGRAGIAVAPVTVRVMPTTLTVPAQVAMDEKHTQHIGALADGRIESVLVLPGDAVRRGQTLATLHSHTVHETVAALTQAFAAVQRQESAVGFATTTRDRYARLYSIQAASLEEKQKSDQDLAQASKDLADAQANVIAEREHLGELLQVRPESLTPSNLYNRELIPVRAVADGVVITRNVTVGQVVSTGDETFVTSNLRTVWVTASLDEKQIALVRPGAVATATIAGSPSTAFRGEVELIGDVVDPQTRTLPVRIVVPNPAMRLRPGMFVTAAIAGQSTRDAIFVPSDALQDINGFRVVFTTRDGTTFYARVVKTGTESNGMVEITDGLAASDRVVVKGAFMVKGELLKGTVGEG